MDARRYFTESRSSDNGSFVELRVPFLDKEVFEVASKIPTSLKTANGTTKYILRKAAEGIVPGACT